MIYRKTTTQDFDAVMKLGAKLWPYRTVEELQQIAEKFLGSPENRVTFLAQDAEQVIGFVMASIKTDYVDGSSSSPVGYIEGIYVEEAYRKQGAAKELVQQVEQWAKEKGCTQIGSDADEENTQSRDFHARLGFKASKPSIRFIKDIV